ncbi:MAG: hypothetical protein KF789_05160 [Bdellovibrionaceae bacterium]|nr:hypothetical protein [Pseudobdellovibrionaceae bacterium]
MLSIVLSRIGTAALVTATLATAANASKPSVGRLMSPKSSDAVACTTRPDFLSDTKSEIAGGFEALPKTVLVARDAEIWVEGQDNNRPVQIHAYQSFLRPKKNAEGRVLCGQTPERFRERFSIVAPTLVDSSKDHKIGHSFWQFQIVADDQKFSVWNHKSPMSTQSGSMSELLKKDKTPYRLFQVGHNEYEMIIQKEASGLLHTLSIRYEALR